MGIKVCFLCLVFFLSSCSNKLDILGKYEEMPSVYGVLDPNQARQYVKINRVFGVSDVPAYKVAMNPDSLFFDSISPTLLEVETGRIISLYRFDYLDKAKGIFASTPNYLYVTNEKIYSHNPTNLKQKYNYRIDLILPRTKKYVTSTTNIPDSIKLIEPKDIYSKNDPFIDLPRDSILRIKFISPQGGKVYDAFLYFNYLEINKSDTNIKVFKTVKWRLLGNLNSLTDNGGENVVTFVQNNSFYDFLLTQIPVDINVKRKFQPSTIEFIVGNQCLNNYIQSSIPSVGIIQRQSEYTNIENGVGVFASRVTSRFNNLRIGINTQNVIISHKNYKSLGFSR